MSRTPITCSVRSPSAERHTPTPKAITSGVYTRASHGISTDREGAPIDESSLMACDRRSYPTHRVAASSLKPT
jgi:hypothetical protein